MALQPVFCYVFLQHYFWTVNVCVLLLNLIVILSPFCVFLLFTVTPRLCKKSPIYPYRPQVFRKKSLTYPKQGLWSLNSCRIISSWISCTFSEANKTLRNRIELRRMKSRLLPFLLNYDFSRWNTPILS